LLISFSILASLVFAWWPDVDLALALEDSPFAWLQSSLLVACGCVLAMRALVSDRPEQMAQRARQQTTWGVLALLLILAALDERFMGHERIQEFLFFDVLHGEPALKHWSQALTAIYGMVGIAALMWMRHTMFASAWRWCRAGVAIGLAAIALDIAVDSVNVQIIEEILEATAETLFLCGLFMEVNKAVTLQR